MKWIKKLFDFIKRIFNKPSLEEKTNLLLNEPQEIRQNELLEMQQNKHQEIPLNYSQEMASKKPVTDEEKNVENKEFFELYQNYKNGKINPKYLLITDLIKIELMMQEEQLILEDKIKSENEKIKKQMDYFQKLKAEREKLTN